MLSARNEMLGAVEHPIASVPYCTALHAAHIRSGVRFGHRQRIHPFPRTAGSRYRWSPLQAIRIFQTTKEMVIIERPLIYARPVQLDGIRPAPPTSSGS
jgi:hypothetical protein